MDPFVSGTQRLLNRIFLVWMVIVAGNQKPTSIMRLRCTILSTTIAASIDPDHALHRSQDACRTKWFALRVSSGAMVPQGVAVAVGRWRFIPNCSK